MTDLEIIKHIEEEIGFEIPCLDFREIKENGFSERYNDEWHEYFSNQFPKDKYDFNKKNPISYSSEKTQEGEIIVTSLQIINANLENIPLSFFLLKNLKELNLSENKITKIPKAVTELNQLETLNLSHNKLKELPEFLFPFSEKLHGMSGYKYHLDFSYNEIEKVPESFFEEYLETYSDPSNVFILKPHEDTAFEPYYDMLVNIYGNKNLKYPPLSSFKDLEKDEEQKDYFASAKEILENLLKPQIKEIKINREGTDSTVKYIESTNTKEKIFKELASGYRSIISMLGDIIIRLSKYQKEVTDFKKLSGIVLIDEIDLHLHPKWKKAMVEKLTYLFPKIQFIVSTHSPIPILGAPENAIIINVTHEPNKGITAKKLTVDFNKLMPNSLLSSPIFNFEDYLPSSLQDLSKLRTEKGYNEILFNDEVERRINKMLQEANHD